ncbi:site-2 protease family protein [Lignipirellula cremea]|uniref:Peptidase family M50 n=1 Tax=Lignipirellula cremea TaxID=2528010 RepID=A0A518E245_9BACT|nr:site-2 protease family protein [Lignipirellula cremea]QDU98151.1 Peptidase family M50 [Lignipirellula cremea]
MLAEPGYTQFDLHFEIFGFPVRVHPWFWAMGLILGALSAEGAGEDMNIGLIVLIWMSAVFMSIVLHELGHAVLMRRAGMSPHIVLYAMGGLAVPGDSSYGSSYSSSSFGRQQGRSSKFNWEKIFISAAGPGIQLLFALALAAIVWAAHGNLVYVRPFYVVVVDIANPYLLEMLGALMFINTLWPLLNLLPVFPLDGGQIAREFFVGADPWNGLRNSLWLSLGVACALAIFALTRENGMFQMFLFASLAFNNYQMLQAVNGGGGGRPW